MSEKQVVEELTPEQEAKLPEYRDRWVAISTSTTGLKREYAEEQLCKAYEMIGKTPPSDIYWASSPLAGAKLAAAIGRGLDPAKALEDDKSMGVPQTTPGCIPAGAISSMLGASIYGQHDCGWLAFFEFFREEVDLDVCKPLDPLIEVAKSAGWVYPFDGVAILCEKPTACHLNDNFELHCEDGPALAYRDGYKLYMSNGVEYPAWVAEEPEKITVESIRDEQNAEIKRIMREKYGEGRYLVDIGAKVIDTDTVAVDSVNPRDASNIVRSLMEDHEGNRYLVGTDGSTPRVYYMRVPNECNTCSEAYEALAGGLTESKCILQT